MTKNKTPAEPAKINLDVDSPAVLKHMEMYQSIITRMATNSASCKKFLIPSVMVLLGLSVKEGNPDISIIALALLVIFGFLDCYYLMLENKFREGFENSAKKIQESEFTKEDLFALKPEDKDKQYWKKSFGSFATWPVYFGLLVIIVLVIATIKYKLVTS